MLTQMFFISYKLRESRGMQEFQVYLDLKVLL